MSGKKYITLKKKNKTAATIKGKKKGKAKVQAKVGSLKLTCTVTVKNAKKADTPSNTTPTALPAATATPAISSNAPLASMGPAVTSAPPVNEEDVAALKKLITEQRERGATVSDHINNSNEYTWKNGRLVEIIWGSDSNRYCC